MINLDKFFKYSKVDFFRFLAVSYLAIMIRDFFPLLLVYVLSTLEIISIIQFMRENTFISTIVVSFFPFIASYLIVCLFCRFLKIKNNFCIKRFILYYAIFYLALCFRYIWQFEMFFEIVNPFKYLEQSSLIINILQIAYIRNTASLIPLIMSYVLVDGMINNKAIR